VDLNTELRKFNTEIDTKIQRTLNQRALIANLILKQNFITCFLWVHSLDSYFEEGMSIPCLLTHRQQKYADVIVLRYMGNLLFVIVWVT
jgi:hypothetical protein